MAAQAALRETVDVEHEEVGSAACQLGLGLSEGFSPQLACVGGRCDGSAFRVCAGCRAKEARYGFVEDPGQERPRSLCFDCFRMELDRRQRAAAQLARGWNAEQERLPLAGTLEEVSLRRRRAQIAARHALGI
jgi:hypothetical protein